MRTFILPFSKYCFW